MNALTFLRREWLALLLLFVPTAFTLFYWNQLPGSIATHWGLNGEPNGFQSPETFLWFTLALNVFIYALFVAIPYLDPKKNAFRLKKPLRMVRIVTMTVTAVLFSSIVLNAVDYSIDVILIGNLAVNLLFLVMGNLMAKFPPNYFAGIRTPWTLESPEVWRQVHQVASKLWVGGALVLLMFLFLLDTPDYTIFSITVIVTLVAIPTIHSYVLYRKLETNH